MLGYLPNTKAVHRLAVAPLASANKRGILSILR